MVEARQELVLIEPWFTRNGHVPFNRAFLDIIRAGFPGARVNFACSAGYRGELASRGFSPRIDHWIEATAWTQSTTDGGMGEFWRRANWLIRLLRRIRGGGIRPTHLILLGCSGPILYALWLTRWLCLARSCGTFAVLHGAEELDRTARPRHPLRRIFQLRRALLQLPAMKIRVIVLEDFIAQELHRRFPEQARQILCVPHGYDDTECLPSPLPRDNPRVVRVLFLGQATPHKGFREFIQLAELARSREAPVEFRAAGFVRRDTCGIDQSALSRRAGGQPLERSELLAELAATDVVFTWQSEHYELRPSGIVVDCIGLCVPMVGRRSRAIAALEARHGACGMFADDIESLLESLCQLEEPQQRERLLSAWKDHLLRAREERSAKALGEIARAQMLG